MTYLGKKDQQSEDSDAENKGGGVVNLNSMIKKDDILKQSIRTVGDEDTSVFFVQSGI